MKRSLCLSMALLVAVGMLLAACDKLPKSSEGLEFFSNVNGTCSVVGIGECTDTDVVIPKKSPDGNRVTSIDQWAFAGTGLTSITIPDSVTRIGVNAFSGCTGLTSITIPDSVTSIEYNAFSGCNGLTNINVSEGNPVYNSEGNCIIRTETFTLIVGCKTSQIPDGVISIGGGAFSGCTGLTSITIPDSVTSIDRWAFAGTGLTSITIPDSVTSIGANSFDGCTALTSITIPDSVTSIDMGAFYGCIGLTSITIPKNVTSISDGVFFGCTGLTSITIPDGVTSIGNQAFDGCTALTDVYYTGSESEWAAIEMNFENEPLKTATIHYNYVPEE